MCRTLLPLYGRYSHAGKVADFIKYDAYTMFLLVKHEQSFDIIMAANINKIRDRVENNK